jgi:3',5'-cyclic AMP phosphodiesterase CpdA
VTFLLAHLSDAHIGPVPRPNLGELIGKRATGYVNWLNKRAAQHDMGVLKLIVDDLKAQAPDHIAMTGDIVNIGLAGEFALARDWLATLGAPIDVSFTPGNHDAYVTDAARALGEVFAPWTRGDDGQGGYPYLRRRGSLAIIGLSSGVPTAPFVASGALGPKQRARLEALLEATRKEGLTRVVLLHHPPWRGGARALRGLDDASDFEAIVARRGAELVLYGHNHTPKLHRLPGPQGAAVVMGAASASAKAGKHMPAASYHLFAIEGQGGAARITLTRRGLDASGTRIVELECARFDPARADAAPVANA